MATHKSLNRSCNNNNNDDDDDDDDDNFFIQGST